MEIVSTLQVASENCLDALLVALLNNSSRDSPINIRNTSHKDPLVLDKKFSSVSLCQFPNVPFNWNPFSKTYARTHGLFRRKSVWPVPRVALLSVATSLLHLAIPRRGARIMLFTGGPCTSGPGAVVSRMKEDDMRSHADLAKKAEPLFEPACQFYEKLANPGTHQPVKKGSHPVPQMATYHVVDVFACSLDQVGLLEMKSLVEATGGLMVLGDSFGQSVFKESLRRVFQTYPDDVPQDGGQMMMTFGGSLEVLTSREVKVSGAIGPVTSLQKNGPNVSDVEVGKGGTNAWSLGGIDPRHDNCCLL